MTAMDHPAGNPGREAPSDAETKILNADSVTPIPPPRSAIPTTRAVLMTGLVTGITAAIVCLCMRITAWVFRADFLADANPFADQVTPVPWQSVFLLPLVAGLLGSSAGAIFLGVRHGKAIVWLGGTALMLASITIPLLYADGASWPTRLWLVGMHVATWLIVVPQVARVIGDSDPRFTRGFRDDSQPPA